jgi:hypothetical protein
MVFDPSDLPDGRQEAPDELPDGDGKTITAAQIALQHRDQPARPASGCGASVKVVERAKSDLARPGPRHVVARPALIVGTVFVRILKSHSPHDCESYCKDR